MEKDAQLYDLVIIGAGCVGVAAAYYALAQDKKVCLIQKGAVQPTGGEKRYWSSSYSARQNRIQYNEEYLTRFVLKSNEEWAQVEADLQLQSGSLLQKQGSVWFGDKNVNTNEGNIKAANAVITLINSNPDENTRIQSLYMEKIMQGSPEYMGAFKPKVIGGKTSQWDAWSALYQPDGGSVQMEAAYTAFLEKIKSYAKFTLYDRAQNITHNKFSQDQIHQFSLNSNLESKIVQTKKVFICAGVFTPHFLKDVMGFPHLVDNNYKNGNNNLEYSILEYVASYIKVNEAGVDLWSNMPNWYNFLEESCKTNQYSGYGFRFHEWDNQGVDPDQNKYIKLGTMACNGFTNPQAQKEYLNNPKYEVTSEDWRAQAALSYAQNRLNEVDSNYDGNKHYTCPIIFFAGRETLLDYLQRSDQSVVVQSGGWIGKYYPLLAKTAMQMIFNPEQIKRQRKKSSSVIGNFLNRTRFPIKPYINDKLNQLKGSSLQEEYKTVVIGAGCSGLYSALRLDRAKHQNIGIFQMSDRISGRLKSFTFHGTSTPFQLGGMRYIPYKHILINHIIQDLGIPSLSFPMSGDPIQNYMRRAYLRNDYYQMSEWDSHQQNDQRLITSYRMKGQIVGMSSFQIISFSLYLILTAPENLAVVIQSFLQKDEHDIQAQKQLLKATNQPVPLQDAYYRDWNNYIYVSKDSPLNYNINLTLKQWNYLKPVLVHRFPVEIRTKMVYEGQEKIKDAHQLFPLYKFGFQNVIEAQFGHEAYQFVAQQNGYFSNTSNASYLDQVMTYLLDFGDVTYRTLAGGFDNINYGMANQLLDKYNGIQTKKGGIYLEHKLVNIVKQGEKYRLTFHKYTHNVDLNHSQAKSFRSTLHSDVPRKKLYNLVHHKLGQPVPLPGKKNIETLEVIAQNIILGIPKRSIQILFNEIQFLQNDIDTYNTYFQQDQTLYQQIFNLTKFTFNGSNNSIQPLSQAEKHQWNTLNEQQFKRQLTQVERNRLIELSNRKLVTEVIRPKYQDKKYYDMQYERVKSQLFIKDKPLLPTNLNLLADSAQAMPAMKICMNFTQNWWDPTQRINKEYQQKYKNTNLVSSVEQMRGVSITDLPVRQTLYFGQGPDNLLLGSYNDMITTEFWTTLHNNFNEEWTPVAKLCKKFETGSIKKIISYPSNQDINPAKKTLVKEILKQLSLIHNITVKEEWLKECIYQFWGNDPFGAGYHNFYSGWYIPSIMRTVRKPWSTQKIHFVGECYSNETGWVEGAFQTAEKLLTEQFGLKELVPHYYAGY